MTGAGMMDCKAALGETAGNVDAAVDWLRKKGLSKAAKKADRVAAEGLIGVAVKGTKGVVVEVNSETDFVARNDLFQGLVKMIANVALDVGADVEKIKAAKTGSRTIAEDDFRNDRQDRREHDAAPRRRAFGRQGRGRQLRAQCGDRGRRQDGRPRRAGIHRQGRGARRARPAACDACRCDQSAGGRLLRSRSGSGDAREGRARREVQGPGQARGDDREDRRVGPQDLLQGGLPARSALHPRRQEERGASLEGSRRQGRRTDQGHGLRALQARRRRREAGIRFRRRSRGRCRARRTDGTSARREGSDGQVGGRRQAEWPRPACPPTVA